MPFCSNCGKGYIEGQARCPNCGLQFRHEFLPPLPNVRAEAVMELEDDLLYRRGVAAVIDTIPILVLTSLLTLNWLTSPAAYVSSPLEAFVLVFFVYGAVLFAVSMAYYVIFEGLIGFTIGKRLTHLVVLKVDGGPCDFYCAFIRNLLRAADGFLFYLVGLIAISETENGQRLGDIFADTVVVRR